jgi:hypothetical protein
MLYRALVLLCYNYRFQKAFKVFAATGLTRRLRRARFVKFVIVTDCCIHNATAYCCCLLLTAELNLRSRIRSHSSRTPIIAASPAVLPPLSLLRTRHPVATACKRPVLITNSLLHEGMSLQKRSRALSQSVAALTALSSACMSTFVPPASSRRLPSPACLFVPNHPLSVPGAFQHPDLLLNCFSVPRAGLPAALPFCDDSSAVRQEPLPPHVLECARRVCGAFDEMDWESACETVTVVLRHRWYLVAFALLSFNSVAFV